MSELSGHNPVEMEEEMLQQRVDTYAGWFRDAGFDTHGMVYNMGTDEEPDYWQMIAINLTTARDPVIRHATVDELKALLPITDEKDDFLPGFGIGQHGTSGEMFLSYHGNFGEEMQELVVAVVATPALEY